MRIAYLFLFLCFLPACQDFDKSKYVTRRANTRNTQHDYPFISGDLFRKFSDHIVDDTHIPFDPKKVKENDIVFVKTKYLRRYVKYMHCKIKKPYILITHNGDEEIPGQFEHLLKDKKIIKWFGMNVVKSHPKLVAVPIGFGSLPVAQIAADLRARSLGKEQLVYLNFNSTHPEREIARGFFSQTSYCKIDNPKPYKEYLEQVMCSKFQVSPRGNGIDCHRVWETIFAGSIPILKSNPLDALYEGLPVLIVKDWSEISESFLEQKYTEISSKEYDLEKLFADYWLKQIAEVAGRSYTPPIN